MVMGQEDGVQRQNPVLLVHSEHGIAIGLPAVNLHVLDCTIWLHPSDDQAHVVPPVRIAAAIAEGYSAGLTTRHATLAADGAPNHWQCTGGACATEDDPRHVVAASPFA